MPTNTNKGEILNVKELGKLTNDVLMVLQGVNTTTAQRVLDDAKTLLADITCVECSLIEPLLRQRQ